jgi:Smg protein
VKENILDVLMYLFENYMDDDEEQTGFDQELLKDELLAAGFPLHEISKAFDWLESLANYPLPADAIAAKQCSTRVYLKEECEKLDLECRGFLIFLEQMGVLETQSRELVIDRVMALEIDEFNLEQLKWVILMVLFNQPGQEAAFAWMEDLVYDEAATLLH